MAITITKQPIVFAPVYNSMVTVASSDNITEDSFSFIYQIYDEAGTTLLSTQRIAPEYKYGFGVIDVARILEGYVYTDFFKKLSGDIKANTNSYVGYTIKIGEEYGVSGTLTQFLDLANFQQFCFNGSVLENDWISFDISNYELDGITKKFLTDSPAIQNVTIEDEGYISMYNGVQVENITYTTYDSAGAVLQTATIDATAFTDKIIQVPSAPSSINSVTLTTGTQPLISSSVASYTIEVRDGDSVRQSEIKTFNLTNCHRGRIHFLNDLGGFDAFNFVASNKVGWKFEKDYYKKNPDRLTALGGYDYSSYDREWTQYYTNQKESLKLISDWVTDEESVWLRSMFSSPEIYLELNGVIRAIKGITQTDYEVKEFEYNELFNIEIDVDFSIDNYRQRA